MNGIASFCAHSEDQIGLTPVSPEARELLDHELSIGVDLENPLSPRELQTPHNRRTVSRVPRRVFNPQPRAFRRETVEDLRRAVHRAVVDDDGLHCLVSGHDLLLDGENELLDPVRLVECREDNRQSD